jgi:CheY-like chemotaxis protein
VLESLRADPLTADIPVVIVGADTRLTEADRLLLAGAAPCLTEPPDVREVLLLLDDISADQLTRMIDA